MAVEEIKEFIVAEIKEYIEFELYVTRRYEQNGVPFIVYQDNMQHILSMLDELQKEIK